MDNSPVSRDSLPDRISPEGASVAITYLKTGCNIDQTASELALPAHEISRMLEEKAVYNYIQHVISEVGIRKMDAIADKLEDLIDTKLAEMNDLDMTSSKDIADLLNMHHRMLSDKAKILEAKNKDKVSIGKVVNTQINTFEASQYGKLMHQLTNGEGN